MRLKHAPCIRVLGALRSFMQPEQAVPLKLKLHIEHRAADGPTSRSLAIPQSACWDFRRLASSSATPQEETEAAGVESCASCDARERTPDELFCGRCGALQRVDRAHSFFKLLGMQEGEFRLDDSLLDRQYKHLQRLLHPDKFSTGSQDQRDLSEEASSLVNEAFSTLKHPLRRAEYILKQKGMDIGEGTVDDPELLMGIMEAREAVELTQSEEELQQFAATFQQQAEACIEGLTQAFRQEDLEKAQDLTTLLRYVTRIQIAIAQKL